MSNKNLECLPAFDFIDYEHNVQINTNTVNLSINGKEYTKPCNVVLDLTSQPKIYVEFSSEGISQFDILSVFNDQNKLDGFTINGKNIEGYFVYSGKSLNSSDENIIRWTPRYEPVTTLGNDQTLMGSVVFHIFNFVEFLSNKRKFVKKDDTDYAIEELTLKDSEWHVKIKSLFETHDQFKILNSSGGYQATHIGCISKTDSSLFSGKEATNLLNALRLILSFAKGCWCVPVCPIGKDSKGAAVWECWSSPKDYWQKPLSWFDPYNSDQLSIIFRGFMELWNEKLWCETLNDVIYWYLNANNSSRGIDAGVILTQTAIERLSFQYTVNEKKLIESQGFKDLKASDKFRLLFSSLNIPLDIPSHLTEMKDLSKKIKWLDAPHALTEIRNSLVHPDHKYRKRVSNTYYEAWNLGLWYLEMSILAVCGYSGKYANRLNSKWKGEVENVPWTD